MQLTLIKFPELNPTYSSPVPQAEIIEPAQSEKEDLGAIQDAAIRALVYEPVMFLVHDIMSHVTKAGNKLDLSQQHQLDFIQQLVAAEEISIQHFMNKMENLFPREMEQLSDDLRMRVARNMDGQLSAI